MFLEARVNYNIKQIQAAYIKAMPIRNNRALQAILLRVVYYRTGQVIFIAISRDSKQIYNITIAYY